MLYSAVLVVGATYSDDTSVKQTVNIQIQKCLKVIHIYINIIKIVWNFYCFINILKTKDLNNKKVTKF